VHRTWQGFAVFIAALLLAAGPSRAALIEADWLAAGDGLLTVDPDTGLQWLDWTASTNLSVDQVMAQLGSGGTFDGFRYATEAEVTQLYVDAGIPDAPGITAANLIPVQELLALVGVTGTGGLGPFAIGWTASFSGGLRVQASLTDRSDDLGQATFVTVLGFGDDFATSTWGHALVRVVPEPGTASLFAVSLALLAVVRRRLR
jgi:hypothetical protein